MKRDTRIGPVTLNGHELEALLHNELGCNAAAQFVKFGAAMGRFTDQYDAGTANALK